MRHGATATTSCAPRSRKAASALPIVAPRAGHKQGCCTASDAQDVGRVADQLNIPFYAIDFQEAFGRIIDYFIDEYSSVRTPNPCVMCNNWIKFGGASSIMPTAWGPNSWPRAITLGWCPTPRPTASPACPRHG